MRPIVTVSLDIALFYKRVTDVPMDQRGRWVTELAESLVERDHAHPLASKLLQEAQGYKDSAAREKRMGRARKTLKDMGKDPDFVDSLDDPLAVLKGLKDKESTLDCPEGSCLSVCLSDCLSDCLSLNNNTLIRESNPIRDTREKTQKTQGGVNAQSRVDSGRADSEARGPEKDHQEARAESGRALQKIAEDQESPRIDARGLRAVDPTQYPTDTQKEPQAQTSGKRRGKSDLSEPNDPDFALWWSHYPRKEAKIPAFLAWEKNRKHLADIQSMIQTLKGQIIAHQWMDPDKRSFVPLPASYINARRWTDEAPPAPKSYEQKMQDHVADVDRFFGAHQQRRISGG